jgi:glycolate oxidase iron-sulfur subunit
MQTRIPAERLADPRVREADAILRTCVHCGFCTATCPTYQLLGDELDGPRGRIYLIKSFLEGEEPTARTRLHLDRCLTCRACETTCPSGVRYGRLADIGREMVEERLDRPWLEGLKRTLLRRVVPYPARFAPLMRLGQALAPLLPGKVRRKVPARQAPPARPERAHPRTMLALAGCAQSVATPATNAAAARVLDRLGIALVEAPEAGCCGAVDQHLAAPEAARAFMRRNIDAWWPHIEAGAEAIVVTASGCGTVVKDYGHLLADDPNYRDKAARVAALARDLCEVLRDAPLPAGLRPSVRRVAFHSPCTLQHGQQLAGVVEGILARAGFHLTPVTDAHLCCGSAGTYSVLQPQLSGRLLENKVRALEAGAPEVIATANVGCQLHLATAAGPPVRHWVELLDEAMAGPAAARPTSQPGSPE